MEDYTMTLFEAQKQIVQAAVDAYQHPNIFRDNKIFISGETGVGKTYIGSAIAAKINVAHQVVADAAKRAILIVAPDTVLLKWKRVLIETDPELAADNRIIVMTRPKEFEPLRAGSISIISIKNLHRYIKQYPIDRTATLPFVIFDEVHKIQKSQLDAFAELIELQTSDHRLPMLLLSGTIFNRSWKDLGKLLTLTHPKLLGHVLNTFEVNERLSATPKRTKSIADDPQDEGYSSLFDALPITFAAADFDGYPWRSKTVSELTVVQKLVRKVISATANKLDSDTIYSLPNFISRIWQYISMGIGIDDVQEMSANTDEIKQEIMPISPIPLSKLERTYLAMTRQFYRGSNPQTREMFIMNYLDQPDRSNLLKPRQYGRVDWFSNQQMYYVNFQLKPIPFNHTTKFKQLKTLIDNNQNKRFLIYAHDQSIVKLLCDELGAFTITSDIEQTRYGEYINEQFDSGKTLAVIDPRMISEGIDISADFLVWYQLIDNYNQMLQAQRRVYRLNSTRKSKVYYLIYADTQQERTAKNLSNASKNNAAVHGSKETDNLAQLTGILLDGIK